MGPLIIKSDRTFSIHVAHRLILSMSSVCVCVCVCVCVLLSIPFPPSLPIPFTKINI